MIRINTFDLATYTIKSIEHNRFIPIWKHTIVLTSNENGSTIYCDEVEIGAGVLTGIVSLWSRFFYRHRQKRWLRLLHQEKYG